ncbi:GyrI-like domain-containing protein [Alkalicoccobacillus porphyridii]|uniref:AraC family transcriptional regulator n=1 Tax=Alkalicoccobacillus porphyridii TaxID=2597270 RepID=A0A554A105_9BACI|nr:effector binding domain-containing protein [Alkalicoccobacillus porphyridii]TSB47374.1 AraC family transcriptional regulator [Alkalicoccobacillus porphyridii]
MNQAVATFTCETITTSFQFVGVSTTANFPNAFPEAAINLQLDFESRVHEIRESKKRDVIFSPYMCNNFVATYFSCVEVSEIKDVPEGMIGFSLPKVRYAKIQCSNQTIGEGYERLFTWMAEKGFSQIHLNNTMPVEIFYPEDDMHEFKAEILIPIGENK